MNFPLSKIIFRGGTENVQQIKKENRRRAEKVLTKKLIVDFDDDTTTRVRT